MNNLESVALSYLINSLWQVPLLYVAAWLVARLAREARPVTDHRIWVTALLLQCLLPAVSLLPWSPLRSLLSRLAADSRSPDARVSIVLGSGSQLGSLHLPHALIALVACAYAALCMFFAARFLWRYQRLAVLRRQSVAVSLSGGVAAMWLASRRQFEVEDVQLAASPQVFGPVTLGVRRKLVLLPADMLADLPPSDLQTVLAHECAHLRRNDFSKNLLYECLSLPVGYHPLLRRTREKVMESREMVCDAMAAQLSGRDEYARSLLRLASLLVAGPPIRTPHAIGIFDANILERRLMRLTQMQNKLSGSRRIATMAACLLLGASVCASALALASNVDGLVAASGADSPKEKGRQAVPASEMAKNILYKVPPVYPREAKEQRIQGKVVLEAIIGKDGAVENLEVVSGPNELQKSALDAVRQWKYKPFLVSGDPVEVKTTINVIYALAE